MKHYSLFLCLVLITTSVMAQFGRQGVNQRNRMPPPQAPTEAQKEADAKKAEERKEEFIATFITTLDADDFQKEIVKQSLDDYFVKVAEFSKIPFDHSAQRKDAFDALKKEHFSELEGLVSEGDMAKINELLDGKYDEREEKKKRKKKRKKKGKN